MPDTDTVDDLAFAAARDMAPGIDPATLRAAIDRYMERLHVHVVRIDAARALTPAEMLDAFRPKTVEF